jgi:hypothetical protein
VERHDAGAVKVEVIRTPLKEAIYAALVFSCHCPSPEKGQDCLRLRQRKKKRRQSTTARNPVMYAIPST